MGESCCGREHPLTNEVRVRLGAVLRDAGRAADAEPVLRTAVAVFDGPLRSRIGPAVEARAEFGLTLHALGRGPAATTLLRAAWDGGIGKRREDDTLRHAVRAALHALGVHAK